MARAVGKAERVVEILTDTLDTLLVIIESFFLFLLLLSVVQYSSIGSCIVIFDVIDDLP